MKAAGGRAAGAAPPAKTAGAPPAPAAPVDARGRLDELDAQIDALEHKRRDLYREAVKEDLEEDGKIHEKCADKEEVQQAEDAAAQAEQEADDAREALERYGGHTQDCLQGALAGTQKLHPLCTCGWNHQATQLERG